MNDDWLENIVNSEDVLNKIMKEVHNNAFDGNPEQNKKDCDNSQDMITMCIKASDLDSICTDENKLSTLETLSILNSDITGRMRSIKTNIIIGGKMFMLAGFIRKGKYDDEEEADEEKGKINSQLEYSAYVKDWDYGLWYRFCFDSVIKKTEREIMKIVAPHEIQSIALGDKIHDDSDDDVCDNDIVYLSYIKCDLDLQNSSEVCESAFETVSGENSTLISDFNHFSGEKFLPIRSVLSDFGHEQLYIRSPCAHGSCSKANMKDGNIMPLKYMKVCHPNDVSSSAINKFYNFCPYGAKCTVEVFDLNNSPTKQNSTANEELQQELRDLHGNSPDTN